MPICDSSNESPLAMKTFVFLLLLFGMLSRRVAAREQLTVEQRPASTKPKNKQNQPQCSMDNNILVVEWNAEASEYVVVEGHDRRLELIELNAEEQMPLQQTERLRRGGRHGNIEQQRPWEAMGGLERTLAFNVNLQSDKLATRRQLMSENDSPSFIVRACQCGDLQTVYCPLELSACSVIGGGKDDNKETPTVECYTPSKRSEDLARTCLFLSTAWFALLFCCLACTECGRVVWHFLRSKFDATHNERLADFLLQHRRHRAFSLIQRNVYHHRWLTGSFQRGPPQEAATNGEDEDCPPTSLALKTHIFGLNEAHDNRRESRHDDTDDDDQLDTQCIICFQKLQHGDRIGDLLCGHEFHADCLKTWLRRRNTCPLCNASNIATPKRGDNSGSKTNRPRAQTQSTASEDGAISAAQLVHGESRDDEENSSGNDQGN